MKSFLFLVALSLPFIGYSQTSYVPATQTLRKRGTQISVGGDYFSKTKGKDKEGKTIDLLNGEKFSRYQGEVLGSYGISDQFQFTVGARYRRNEATRFLVDKQITENLTGSGFESALASLKYSFKPVNQYHFMVEANYRYTPYTTEKYTAANAANNDGDVVLGDDGNDLSAGLGISYVAKNDNFLTVRGGYRRPGKDLSSEVYWNAEGAMAWKYLALLAGVDGVTSLNNDAYTEDPENKPAVNSFTTNLYNSINREYVAPYVGLNLALGSQWRIEARGSQIISGRSTDLGTSYSIYLVRRVEDKGLNKVDNRFKSYDLEGSVIKVSPKKNYVVIDRGISMDVKKGMKFDFFEFDYLGGNILVASGSVVQVKADSAIVKLTQHYNRKKEIKEGLVARATLATFK
jgi:hypothetical protein